ncbi:MAG: aspartate kinase [Fretibacterium sp.]|nr:aspartate kinase [Fretibacterium sp.]
MNSIVVKFGGTSLADVAQIRKAAAIVQSNPERRYVVVSAPGKRDSTDVKVTDLLYQCYSIAARGDDFSGPLSEIHARFSEIARGLQVSLDLEAEFDSIRRRLTMSPDQDYVASRGEYLNARIIAAYLGFDFVPPEETIFFTDNGKLDEDRTFRVMGEKLAALPHAVIPGFYGVMPIGVIRTFSRGGSDITGSIVARAVNAHIYENWTDVSGMLSADPRIVNNPKVIRRITYTELRELSYMGASVLHEDAIFPVRTVGIPINIRNTNCPEDPGTLIASTDGTEGRVVTGIAGRKGFSAIVVEKSMMNAEVGFGARLLQIFAEHGVPFEHCPTGIDMLSVVVSRDLFNSSRDEILQNIQEELTPDAVSIHGGLAMIAVVGQGMASSRGTAMRIFKALAEAEINIRMIDQGPSELNIIVGVNEADYENAVRVIYAETESLM